MTHSKVVWVCPWASDKDQIKEKGGGTGKRFKYYRRQSRELRMHSVEHDHGQVIRKQTNIVTNSWNVD